MKVSVRIAMESGRGGVKAPAAALEAVAKMGFDGIELCFEAGPWQFQTAAFYSEEAIGELMSLCKKLGLEIFSVSSDWAWVYASLFPKLSGWQGRGMDLIADDARLAKRLGGEAMLIHFGTSKGSWEDCKVLCKQAGAIGAETGVRLGYEANIWERLGFGGLDSLNRMVDEVGSKGFGSYLHNSYPRSGLPLEQELAVAGTRLVNTMHSSELTGGGRMPVQIDWAKAYPAIKKYLPGCIYTFEVDLPEVEASKKLFDEIMKKYE
jgi:hypothetical protein